MASKPHPFRFVQNQTGTVVLIGYMRVSTAGQSFDLQRDAIAKAGCERVYDDTCSGCATERPGRSARPPGRRCLT